MKQQTWLNQLKGAVVQQNLQQVEKLLEDIPNFQDPKEIESALYLIQEAKRVAQNLKDETAATMKQLKKNIEFLNSATAEAKAKFDIIS